MAACKHLHTADVHFASIMELPVASSTTVCSTFMGISSDTTAIILGNGLVKEVSFHIVRATVGVHIEAVVRPLKLSRFGDVAED